MSLLFKFYPFGKVIHSFDDGVLFSQKLLILTVPSKRAHRIVVVGVVVVRSAVGVHIPNVRRISI